jgi:hypothetical protein
MDFCTSSPVQNIGHLFHGVSLASPSHVLKYGLRTTKGSTGGVSFEASTGRLSSAEPAATAATSQCIVEKQQDTGEASVVGEELVDTNGRRGELWRAVENVSKSSPCLIVGKRAA